MVKKDDEKKPSTKLNPELRKRYESYLKEFDSFVRSFETLSYKFKKLEELRAAKARGYILGNEGVDKWIYYCSDRANSIRKLKGYYVERVKNACERGVNPKTAIESATKTLTYRDEIKTMQDIYDRYLKELEEYIKESESKKSVNQKPMVNKVISKTHGTTSTALSYIPKGYDGIARDKPAPKGYYWIYKDTVKDYKTVSTEYALVKEDVVFTGTVIDSNKRRKKIKAVEIKDNNETGRNHTYLEVFTIGNGKDQKWFTIDSFDRLPNYLKSMGWTIELHKEKSTAEKPPKKATNASRVKTARKLLNEGRLQAGHVTRLGVKKQTPPASKSRAADRQRKAMLPGYRVSQSGNLYYETRGNRSDTPKERRDFAHAAIHSRRGTRLRRARLGISRDVFLPKYSLKITPNDTPDAGTKGINYLPADKIKKGKILTEAAQMEIVKTIARRYNKSDIEYGFVVDKYGNVLYISKGTAAHCGNPPLKWWIEHKDDRLIHVHNHPAFDPQNNWYGVTSTFSRGDLKNTTLIQRKHCLVTGYDGTIHAIKINPDFNLPQSTLTRMYNQAYSYAHQAINSDSEVIKSSEEMKKALEKIEAGDTVAIKRLREKHQKIVLQKLVDYEVKKYKELFSQYKGGTVLKWIEDHL